MNIDMTKTLRELRKQKNVTQEQLANFLGITPQSVGKWERGGYPDITLLPKIALYFNVTVDTLLGVDEARIKEAIEGYEKESKRLSNIGDVEVELKLWEKAYEECLTALQDKNMRINRSRTTYHLFINLLQTLISKLYRKSVRSLSEMA